MCYSLVAMSELHLEGKVMKVIYVVTGLGMGGAEHIVVSLAEQAYLQGHQVSIIYLTGKIKVKPHEHGINIISIGMNGYKDFFRALWQLKRIINKTKPDVVHSHMVHANLITRLTRILSPIPRLICTAHSSNEGGGLRMLAYRLTNRLADYTTNVSFEAARALEEKGAASKGEILVVANGVDTDRFNVKEEVSKRVADTEGSRVFNIISVGRLESVKDYPVLLKAVDLLKSRGHRIKLKIVGDGSEKEKLLKHSFELGLTETVEWLGVRKDIPLLLSQADIFVSTSHYEGFGLVAAEAMSCKLPVVSTNNGGVSEVLGDSRWLVDIQSPLKLANKIEEMMLLDDDKRKEIGKKNRNRVIEKYSLAIMYENYMNLYQS